MSTEVGAAGAGDQDALDEPHRFQVRPVPVATTEVREHYQAHRARPELSESGVRSPWQRPAGRRDALQGVGGA